MTGVFVFFAVVGGTLLLGQLALAMLGFIDAGGMPHDLPHDMAHDLPHDLSGAEHGGVESHPGDAPHDQTHQHGEQAAADSTWLFQIISVRTVIAAMAFFGLTGMAIEAAAQPIPAQVGGALVGGFLAMLGVHYLMKQIGRLATDGTTRIGRALGQVGTVYIPIAAGRGPSGKVQVKVNNQIMEYEAVTNGSSRLATGTKIRVIGIQGNMLEVQPLEVAAVEQGTAVKV